MDDGTMDDTFLIFVRTKDGEVFQINVEELTTNILDLLRQHLPLSSCRESIAVYFGDIKVGKKDTFQTLGVENGATLSVCSMSDELRCMLMVQFAILFHLHTLEKPMKNSYHHEKSNYEHRDWIDYAGNAYYYQSDQQNHTCIQNIGQRKHQMSVSIAERDGLNEGSVRDNLKEAQKKTNDMVREYERAYIAINNLNTPVLNKKIEEATTLLEESSDQDKQIIEEGLQHLLHKQQAKKAENGAIWRTELNFLQLGACSHWLDNWTEYENKPYNKNEIANKQRAIVADIKMQQRLLLVTRKEEEAKRNIKAMYDERMVKTIENRYKQEYLNPYVWTDASYNTRNPKGKFTRLLEPKYSNTDRDRQFAAILHQRQQDVILACHSMKDGKLKKFEELIAMLKKEGEHLQKQQTQMEKTLKAEKKQWERELGRYMQEHVMPECATI